MSREGLSAQQEICSQYSSARRCYLILASPSNTQCWELHCRRPVAGRWATYVASAKLFISKLNRLGQTSSWVILYHLLERMACGWSLASECGTREWRRS
jgi:hypothetical protein